MPSSSSRLLRRHAGLGTKIILLVGLCTTVPAVLAFAAHGLAQVNVVVEQASERAVVSATSLEAALDAHGHVLRVFAQTPPPSGLARSQEYAVPIEGGAGLPSQVVAKLG